MISYPVYKIIHLTSIMVLFSGLSIALYGGQSRPIKVLTGIGTLLALVSGMGLMARLGITHGESWPLWIKVKMGVWFVVGMGGAIIAKRFPKYGRAAYFLSLGLFVLAVTSAIKQF